MGHRHSRESLLGSALEVAQDDGLHRLTFGRVAARAGVSDRIVVYYFPDKAALITAVLGAVGQQLEAGLEEALSGRRARTHRELVRLAWPALDAAGARQISAVYIEALGLAAAGVAPYVDLAAAIVSTWEGWLVEHLDGPRATRPQEASAALALLDGLLMVRFAGGAEAADRAFVALGLGASG